MDKILFAIYIGGKTKESMIELHDVRFCISPSIQQTHEHLRNTWWGTPESLHIDCYCALKYVDGHTIQILKTPSDSPLKLYFVNVGGYIPQEFQELHKNIFCIAESPSKAKVKALKQIKYWDSFHVDYLFDVDDVINISDLAMNSGHYIHLEPSDQQLENEMICRYWPISLPQ